MPARFRFRLQPLLDLRQRAEREHQLRVAHIQQEANALHARIQGYQNQITAENRTLTAQQLVGRLDLAYIATEKRYVGNLQVLIITTAQKLALVDRQLTVAKAELLAAAQARKALEKLREKQHQRQRADLERQETAAIDEIGTQLALRHLAQDANTG